MKAAVYTYILACLLTHVYGCGLPSSCQQLAGRVVEGTTIPDGHYVLAAGPGCTPVLIYCASMDTSPADYISLTGDNFSHHKHTSVGNRNTIFSKLRVDLTTMEMVINDYLFATVTPGFNPEPYLSSDSCNSGDPGTFKGDLTGTGLLFSNLVQVRIYGSGQTGHVDYSSLVISGYCTGSCGHCDMVLGVDHHLEVDPDNSVPSLTPYNTESHKPLLHIDGLATGTASYTLHAVNSLTPGRVFATSFYQVYNLSGQGAAILKLVIVTTNVPCVLGSGVTLSVVTSQLSGVTHLTLCTRVTPHPDSSSQCVWMFVCDCTATASHCKVHVAIYTAPIQAGPGRIIEMRPVWT